MEADGRGLLYWEFERDKQVLLCEPQPYPPKVSLV